MKAPDVVDGDDLWKTCIKITLGNEVEYHVKQIRAIRSEVGGV